MNWFGFFFPELDPVFCHFDPTGVAVVHGLKSYKRSDSVVLLRCILIRKLELLSPAIHLLLWFVVLDRIVGYHLFFPTFQWYIVNSRDIKKTRIWVYNFARGACFWTSGTNLCLRSPYSSDVLIIRINCMYDAWQGRCEHYNAGPWKLILAVVEILEKDMKTSCRWYFHFSSGSECL